MAFQKRIGILFIAVLPVIISSLIGCGRDERSRELYERGKELYLSRRLDEAETSFERALTMNHRFKQSYLMLAKCRYYSGRESEALQPLLKVLDLYPSYVEALYFTARIYDEGGRTESALEHLIRVLEEDSGHLEARCRREPAHSWRPPGRPGNRLLERWRR